GAAAQSLAKAASPWRRSMFWPAVTSSWPALWVPTPKRATVRGAAGRDQPLELAVEFELLALEFADPACEAAQRELRRLQRLRGARLRRFAVPGIGVDRLVLIRNRVVAYDSEDRSLVVEDIAR